MNLYCFRRHKVKIPGFHPKSATQGYRKMFHKKNIDKTLCDYFQISKINWNNKNIYQYKELKQRIINEY